jgi:hypothetical protein
MNGMCHSVGSPGTGCEHRLQPLEAWPLEGPQDAVDRQARPKDKNIGELRRRTEPKQIAHDLSQDARKRRL